MRKQERLPDFVFTGNGQLSNILLGKDYADAEEVLFYCVNTNEDTSTYFVQVTYLDSPPQSGPSSPDWVNLRKDDGGDFVLYNDQTVVGKSQSLPRAGRAATGIRVMRQGTLLIDKVFYLSKLVQ